MRAIGKHAGGAHHTLPTKALSSSKAAATNLGLCFINPSRGFQAQRCLFPLVLKKTRVILPSMAYNDWRRLVYLLVSSLCRGEESKCDLSYNLLKLP